MPKGLKKRLTTFFDKFTATKGRSFDFQIFISFLVLIVCLYIIIFIFQFFFKK